MSTETSYGLFGTGARGWGWGRGIPAENHSLSAPADYHQNNRYIKVAAILSRFAVSTVVGRESQRRCSQKQLLRTTSATRCNVVWCTQNAPRRQQFHVVPATSQPNSAVSAVHHFGGYSKYAIKSWSHLESHATKSQ